MFKPGLQQEQSSYYEMLMKQLAPEEQQILQAAVQQADTLNAQRQAEAAQQQTNGSG